MLPLFVNIKANWRVWNGVISHWSGIFEKTWVDAVYCAISDIFISQDRVRVSLWHYRRSWTPPPFFFFFYPKQFLFKQSLSSIRQRQSSRSHPNTHRHCAACWVTPLPAALNKKARRTDWNSTSCQLVARHFSCSWCSCSRDGVQLSLRLCCSWKWKCGFQRSFYAAHCVSILNVSLCHRCQNSGGNTKSLFVLYCSDTKHSYYTAQY